MNAIYVVIENGVPYNVVYQTFESAVAVVKAKHKETVDEQIREENGDPICSELDIPENTITGKTELYVEKEIFITIYKLPILGVLQTAKLELSEETWRFANCKT